MLTQLNRHERVFLAGCIKSMLMSDGTIEEQENADLDDQIARLRFADFDDCLAEFEATVKDEEGFWEQAKAIEREEVRDLILEALRELMVHGGVPGRSGEHLLEPLKEIWSL